MKEKKKKEEEEGAGRGGGEMGVDYYKALHVLIEAPMTMTLRKLTENSS